MDLSEGAVAQEKYYSPKTLRNRHLAIMERLLARPEVAQEDLAAELGLSPARFSVIVNSPLFLYAFKEYRKNAMEKISDLVVEATVAAVQFSKEVVQNKDIDLTARQVSARDILAQGHAKAIDKKVSANFEVPIPVEALGGLEKILAELAQPFKASRLLTLPPTNGGEEDGE